MKRIGSALVRSISRTSSSSCSSSSDDEAYAAGTTAEITPSTTPATTTASNSPTPSITAPLSPLQRTVSALSRFSLTPPKSDPFEQLEAERQKRESKHRKRTEKKVAAFHSDITGAVFVGTVKFFPEPGVELPSAPIETEKGKENDFVQVVDRPVVVAERMRIGIEDIKPKDAPNSKSQRHAHFETFASYYNDYDRNGMVLECFFDVFLKDIPREGTPVSFFAKPTGENGEYVAVACNVESRYNRF